MHTELIDVMGDDLRVVNAARVSFDKESNWEVPQEWCEEGQGYIDRVNQLSEKDIKLLSYLAKHGHWTPFSHVMITMRETVPIFVARQRFKHMVGFTYNEVSRRYVSDEPSFFVPSEWRKAAENKKQGSSDEVFSNEFWGNDDYKMALDVCLKVYNDMVKDGVAPEQARMVLPQSMYTSYYVTGSLAAWARAFRLRSDSHAQMEIRELATQWGTIIGGIEELKYSWKALTTD